MPLAQYLSKETAALISLDTSSCLYSYGDPYPAYTSPAGEHTPARWIALGKIPGTPPKKTFNISIVEEQRPNGEEKYYLIAFRGKPPHLCNDSQDGYTFIKKVRRLTKERNLVNPQDLEAKIIEMIYSDMRVPVIEVS